MYLYQKKNEFFAQVANEFIPEAKKELSWLGAKAIGEEFRGLKFKADKKTLYNANYKSRLVTRILAPLTSFRCNGPEKLYGSGRKIEWSDFISQDATFAIFANVSDSRITNSHFASLKLKDSIADYFMEKTGRRPNVDNRMPDVWINLYIRKDQAVISIDTSGGSLHKRGYRKKSVDAPMQETLAAEIIQLMDWDTEQPVYDPMCGTGTLLCEAFMYASNIPAGHLKKRFGFENLPDFDRKIWHEILETGRKRIFPVENDLIRGSDISKQAVEASRFNLSSLPGGKEVRILKSPFQKIENLEDTIIVTNPPYGIRLNRGEDLSDFYKEFGDFLKNRCKGATAFVYFGDRSYLKKIGLRTTWKKPLKNGGIDGRLAKFELY